jgi:hypothetical protein
MFVVSLSGSKIKKKFFLFVGIFSVFVILFGIFCGHKKMTCVSVDGRTSMTVKDSEEVLNFISSLGWEVDQNPMEVREVVIPGVFDDVYSGYNDIQLSQGFDLQKYAGQRVKRWTFIIRNYPGTEPEDDFVRINILVCDDEVIGGDVCSIKLDGFMHGIFKE